MKIFTFFFLDFYKVKHSSYNLGFMDIATVFPTLVTNNDGTIFISVSKKLLGNGSQTLPSLKN